MNGHNQPGLGGRQPLPIPHTAGPRPAARFFGEPEAVPLRISRQLREVSPFMADADLAAFRGAGAIARLISIGARGPYTHVGLIARSWGQVLLLEMRELAGGRIVTLRSQVEKYPGQIDWFRLDRGRFPEFDPAAAIARMVQFSGQPYGYWELARMAAAHIPFLRLGVLGQPYRPGRPLVCSTAVDLACSEGGLVDPVPQRPNQTTEPQDLTESHLWKYSCTLTPSSPSLPAW